ncbi:hypothetical protein A9236_06880 [Polynucleobacter sp. QLW-P1DATA-2]|nr:hypothetical protein A9236_06880 [Polynucleobacter sp. QLW-P1DATA-2]
MKLNPGDIGLSIEYSLPIPDIRILFAEIIGDKSKPANPFLPSCVENSDATNKTTTSHLETKILFIFLIS